MATAGLRILVLEDDEMLQRAFSRTLRRAGHEVTIAADADECRTKLASAPPDVLLLDRDVPGGPGWDLAKEAPEGVRVVLMTGHPPPDAPPHLLKPMTTEALLAAIEG